MSGAHPEHRKRVLRARDWSLRSKRGPPQTARWPRAASPAAASNEPLQVLSGRHQECFGVHLWETTEPEASQAVPVFGLTEERLHPDPALAHGLLVSGRVVIAADSVEQVGIEGPADLSALIAGGTRGFHRASVAGRSVGPINHDVFGELRGVALQRVPLGTAVLVALTVVVEVLRTIIG